MQRRPLTGHSMLWQIRRAFLPIPDGDRKTCQQYTFQAFHVRRWPEPNSGRSAARVLVLVTARTEHSRIQRQRPQSLRRMQNTRHSTRLSRGDDKCESKSSSSSSNSKGASSYSTWWQRSPLPAWLTLMLTLILPLRALASDAIRCRFQRASQSPQGAY